MKGRISLCFVIDVDTDASDPDEFIDQVWNQLEEQDVSVTIKFDGKEYSQELMKQKDDVCGYPILGSLPAEEFCSCGRNFKKLDDPNDCVGMCG